MPGCRWISHVAGSARPRQNGYMTIWMCKVSAGNLHANSFCQLIMLIERWMLLTVSDRADNKAPIKMFAHFKRSPQHVELNCNLRAIVCVCVRNNNKVWADTRSLSRRSWNTLTKITEQLSDISISFILVSSKWFGCKHLYKISP